MPPHMLKLSSGVVLSLGLALGLTAASGCTSGFNDSSANAARSRTSVETTSAALAPRDAAVPPSAPIYDPCPTDGTPCRIMPLGDSLTSGTDDRDGYRGALYQRLKTLGRPFDFVGSLPGGTAGTAHEGHPGMHIDLLAHYADIWLPATKPHVVLLLMGSNDVDMNYLGHAATYGKILDTCLSLLPNSLFIIGLIPTTTSHPERVVAFNAALVDIVKTRAAQGKHVQMVDTHAALRVRDLGPDGLHPAHPGYVRLADVWYTALVPFMRAR
jgi:lysophospholipase L1-like esterase